MEQDSSRRRADPPEPSRKPGGASDGMPSWRKALGEAGPYLGLGLQIALTMAFYVGLGLGLDSLLNTLPWLTIAGALLGLATVLYYVAHVAEELGKQNERREGEGPSKAP